VSHAPLKPSPFSREEGDFFDLIKAKWTCVELQGHPGAKGKYAAQGTPHELSKAHVQKN
jgi:hypothetical protein